jgi:hypothetical protein
MMREIIVRLPSGRHFVVEAEGKDVDSVAQMAAAQDDAHRDERGKRNWTLKPSWDGSLPVDQFAAVDAAFQHGAIVELHELPRPIPEPTEPAPGETSVEVNGAGG